MELLNIRKELIISLREDIPELVDKFNHFVLIPFPSKKNYVMNMKFNKATERFPKEMVLKLFLTENADKERDTLIMLKKKGITVPEILYYKKPYLILEKADGVNLCDYINDKLKKVTDLDDLDKELKDSILKSVEKLAEWIADFHKKNIISKRSTNGQQVLNKGDTRIRDFIYDPLNEKITGVDFEEVYEGNHTDDLAWISCAILDTKPGIFEMNDPKPKTDLINYFLEKYYTFNPDFEFKFNYFAELLIEDLNIVMERRNLDMSLNKSNFIKDLSKDL